LFFAHFNFINIFLTIIVKCNIQPIFTLVNTFLMFFVKYFSRRIENAKSGTPRTDCGGSAFSDMTYFIVISNISFALYFNYSCTTVTSTSTFPKTSSTSSAESKVNPSHITKVPLADTAPSSPKRNATAIGFPFS